jgi:cytochrome c peroxidase
MLARLILILGIILGVVPSSTAMQTDKAAFARPTSIPFPADAPYSPQVATLGKMLYFDPRLSGAQNMSCASCHNPSFGWETPVETAVGAANEPLGRHAPTVINMAWVKPYFWDGRAATLEEQAAGPITADVEMAAKFEDVVRRLRKVDEYNYWFTKLFPGEGLSRETILTSIATYERTIVSGWAPFDRWVEGDEEAISASAKRGFDLFVGKMHCANCHSGWNFTDNEFHDIGLLTDDIGRAALEPDNPKAMYAFKTPGLRNTTLRAPFGHAGQVWDLETLISHYASGGIQRPSLSKKMRPFSTTPEEIADVVAFLETLTEETTDVPTPILPAN